MLYFILGFLVGVALCSFAVVSAVIKTGKDLGEDVDIDWRQVAKSFWRGVLSSLTWKLPLAAAILALAISYVAGIKG